MDKRKKRQQSSIDRLPPDILEQLHALLRDPRITDMEATRRINAVLSGQAEASELPEGTPERLSKSAVNRYSLSMSQAGEKMQQAREVAKMWIGKMGATSQGQLGNLVNEILRTLAFDITLQLQDQNGELSDDAAEGSVKMLKDLSLAMQRLEKAATLNVAREKEIRQQALETLGNTVDAEEKRGGKMTSERFREIIREQYGV